MKLHLQKLLLVNIIMYSLLGSYLDFPQYILLAASYRFISNVEVAIKN